MAAGWKFRKVLVALHLLAGIILIFVYLLSVHSEGSSKQFIRSDNRHLLVSMSASQSNVSDEQRTLTVADILNSGTKMAKSEHEVKQDTGVTEPSTEKIAMESLQSKPKGKAVTGDVSPSETDHHLRASKVTPMQKNQDAVQNDPSLQLEMDNLQTTRLKETPVYESLTVTNIASQVAEMANELKTLDVDGLKKAVIQRMANISQVETLQARGAVEAFFTKHLEKKASHEQKQPIIACPPPPADTNLSSLTRSFVRAAVVYLPAVNDGGSYVPEIRWFLRAWREMLLCQPENWRTDVIVVTEYAVSVLVEQWCTSKLRTHRSSPSRCIYVSDYVALHTTEVEFTEYNYAESVGIFIWPRLVKILSTTYDFILRTDIDTFLSPLFSKWRPPGFVVGQGGYLAFSCQDPLATMITCKRLRRIADNLRLRDSSLDGVGSTWYGPANEVLRAANLSVHLMKHLHNNEFTLLEKSRDFWASAKNWPEWHYGVLTMYAGHLAINHFGTGPPEGFPMGVVKQVHMLDWGTDVQDCKTVEHAHFHTWHSEEPFSKFAFKSGQYAGVDKSTLDPNSCKDYAMFIAKDSEIQTTSEIGSQVANADTQISFT